MAGNPVQDKSYQFALTIIRLFKTLQDRHEFVLSKQLLRSGTSIGANVEEGLAGQSRRDFLAKMAVASKEARETHYWLRLVRDSQLVEVDVSSEIEQAEELIRILTAIVKTTAEH